MSLVSSKFIVGSFSVTDTGNKLGYVFYLFFSFTTLFLNCFLYFNSNSSFLWLLFYMLDKFTFDAYL